MRRFHFRLKNLHYAWYILAVCFLLNMLVQALVMSVSNLYIVPMYNDLGVPRSLLTLQSTCIMVSAILSAPVWGRLYKNGNARKLLPAAIAGTALCVAGRSFCPDMRSILPLAFVKGIFFTGSTLLPISILLTSWFQKKRGFAVSCAAIGSSFGGVLLSPFVEYLISSYGWRNADRFMGLLLLAVCVPAACLIVRSRLEDIGLRPYGAKGAPVDGNSVQTRDSGHGSDGAAANNTILCGSSSSAVSVFSSTACSHSAGVLNDASTCTPARSAGIASEVPLGDPTPALRLVRKRMGISEALRYPVFYLLLLAVFGMTFANGAALQLPTYLMDIGYSPGFAARTVSCYMAVGIPGKLLLGYLVDRFGLKIASVYNCSLAILAFVCFILAESCAALPGIIIFFGLTSGISSMMPTLLTACFFGGSSYGPIYGIIVSANRLGGGIGTLLVAILFDLTGAYHIIWNCCLVMMLVTLFAILLCFRITKPRPAQSAFIKEHA